MQRFLAHRTAVLCLAAGLSGCAVPHLAASDGLGRDAADGPLPFGARVIERTATPHVSDRSATPALPLLSPGDRIVLALPDGDEFAGSYAVGSDGHLRIPYMQPLSVRGLSVDAAEQRLAAAMVDEGLLAAGNARVSLEPQLWAAVKVHVAGAVFAAGPVMVNDRTHVETRPDMKTRSGDFAPDRYFAAAIRAAGGLRPDADLTHALLIRDGIETTIDLRPLLEGAPVDEPPLLDGDQVRIASVGRFQAALARPSALTPPGFRIYASNLSIPSPSNGQSGVTGEATRLPTGARLSHALASANCIGGTQMTNAHRSALLVTRDPVTQALSSHVYRVYDVTRHANDPANNPYLMPEDAVACFDGSVTVARDLARTALDALLPIQVLRSISNGYVRYD
ncbi:MAG: polysaccharide export protein [Gammaproteobacteria bacterium]|nr:polysaccharide export protein [Gammaproteobacteria bacterium]